MISMDRDAFEKLSERDKAIHTLITEEEYIKDCLAKGDYEHLFCFGNFSLYGYTDLEAYKLCHDQIPEDKRYHLLLDIYTNARSFKGIKRYLKELKKLRPEGYDKELRPLADKDGFVTIYRGAWVFKGKKLQPADLSYSWTVNEAIAHWFATRFPGDYERHVYRAKIPLKDVIAYLSDRSEEEVIVCGGLRDIEEIPIDAQKGAQWRESIKNEI